MSENNKMSLEQAQKVLTDCVRDDLSDHAFGDAEVSWFRKGVARDAPGAEVAYGYFGSTNSVTMLDPTPPKPGETRNFLATFRGDEAQKLRDCGESGNQYRNDVNGNVPGIVLTLDINN